MLRRIVSAWRQFFVTDPARVAWENVRMLEGIDRIDWHELKHAYGPADDVPGQIRALASDKERVREKALHELWGNIIHQGTVYEATSYAVPFLIELLDTPGIEAKPDLLCLVAALAFGTSYHDVHQPLFEDMGVLREEMKQPGWQLRMQEELGWVEAARLAVIAGVPTYLKLLDDADPAIRLSAAYTLAVAPDRAAEIVPVLRRRLDNETDDRVRTSVILSLGCLGGSDLMTIYSEWLDEAGSPAVRVAAALSMARVAGERMPQAAIEVLIDALVEPGSVDDIYSQLPWSDGESVVADVSHALSRLGPAAAESFVPRILDALDALPPHDTGSITMVETVLALTLAPHQGQGSAADLSHWQRHILTRLVHSERAWDWGNVHVVFREFGLPGNQEELAAFLGLAPLS